jgi:uncharacterized membrane protein (DUF373 family)
LQTRARPSLLGEEEPMESIGAIRRHYRFTSVDEENRVELAKILLPSTDPLVQDFYSHLMEDPYTATFVQTDEVRQRHQAKIRSWFKDLFTAQYNNAFIHRLYRIGKTHVKIGLNGHQVNAGMNFIRSFCLHRVADQVSDPIRRADLLDTMHKVFDISLDVMTSSYREEELKKVFLSYRVESLLIRWAERMLHGLNLILMMGLLAMAVGIASLLAYDIFQAFTVNLDTGVIKALGSLLILWMMIELLRTQVDHLRGGKLHVRIFVELALVAFIRKLFIAAIEEKEPIIFALLLAALLVLGVIFYFVSKGD